MRGYIRTALAWSTSILAWVLVLPALLPAVVIRTVSRVAALAGQAVEPPHSSWPELMRFHPELGWKPQPNQNTYCETAHDPELFHVVTDPDGWPGLLTVEESDVIVVGDSLAFGYAVDHAQSFANKAGTLRVKGVGAPGYNLVQEVILMRLLGPSLSGKPVIWIVYYGNDLYDNLSPQMRGYRTPFVRRSPTSGDWEIVTSHVTSAPWLASEGRHRRGRHRSILDSLHRPNPFSSRAYSASRFLLQEAKTICSLHGASLIVFAAPSPLHLRHPNQNTSQAHIKREDYTGVEVPDRAFAEMCEELGIPLIKGSEWLTREHFRRTDDHWNVRGHDRVAELVQEAYRKHGHISDPVSDRVRVE